jgi:CO/xanthine dehydrogenase FAD-binding subunit
MTDWQNGDAAEIRHALASERWRFATTGVADDVKMVHEHDRALVSKTALADRIMELEVELADEKAKNAASAEVRELPIPSHLCSLSSRVLSTWGS